MILVNKIRSNNEIMELEDAVDEAVKYCIEHDVLKAFLTKHRAEVKDMCITEFNEKVFVDGVREEGRTEGKVSGRAQEIVELGHEFGLSEDDITSRLQKKLNISLQKAQEYLAMFGKPIA